jgi:hypothetical protein
VLLGFSPCRLPSPLPRQDQAEALSFARYPGCGLPLKDGGSAPATPVFGACLVFTHVTACKLAESPERPLLTKGFDDFVTSIATSAASGWNDRVAGWVSHPRDHPNLCTAHTLFWRALETRPACLGLNLAL